MSKVIEVYRILKDKLGEEEARVVAEAFEELGGVKENIATKQDIENLRGELKEDVDNLRVQIENLRKELKEDISKLENRIWWIVIGIIIVLWLFSMIAILFK